MIEQMPQNHLLTQVNLETIGTVEVSTIDFNTNPYVSSSRHSETCLFWGFDEHGISRESEVVAVYPNWEEAQQAHDEWCKPERVAKAIVEYMRGLKVY